MKYPEAKNEISIENTRDPYEMRSLLSPWYSARNPWQAEAVYEVLTLLGGHQPRQQ
jgi:hypothetical protein